MEPAAEQGTRAVLGGFFREGCAYTLRVPLADPSGDTARRTARAIDRSAAPGILCSPMRTVVATREQLLYSSSAYAADNVVS